MADDARPISLPEHSPDLDDVQLMNEALQLTPGERNRFEKQLKKVGAKEAVEAHVRWVAKMKPEQLEQLRENNAHWRRVFSIIDKPPPDPLAVKVFQSGQDRHKRKVGDAARARFATQAAEPERVGRLAEDHAAMIEQRTVYPTTVDSAWMSPRLLVSGHNNAKLGARVEKGAWAKAPIYALTLEERATCPPSSRASCQAYCYGNAMHLARRHDARSHDFLDFLRSELWLLSRANRTTGVVIRLHTLGDFYSVEYVEFWREMLRRILNLRVWGYTHNQIDAADPQERAIAQALADLAAEKWDQFAMRFSDRREPQSTIVIDKPEEAAGALICPAQHGADDEAATASCATCGLCWSESARGKTIAFLRHGMKSKSKGAPTDEA